MSILWLLTLTAVATGACVILVRILHACGKRRLLAQARGIASDAAEGAGISVLCSGVSSLPQVENLLSVEYARYEVVVVLDARRYPAEFELLTARYRMLRVEWNDPGELPTTGIRALGRSRMRRYRRLLLVDRVQDTPNGDLDAAAAVASYDYLLPVCRGQRLLPDTVARLVAELGEYPPGDVTAIRSWIGEPTLLLAREAVVEAGGFGAAMPGAILACRQRTLWEPLLWMPGRRHIPRGGRRIAAAGLGAAIIAASMAGWWALTATLLTAAVVWSAAACALLALRQAVAPEGVRLFGAWRYCCKLRHKNFLIS